MVESVTPRKKPRFPWRAVLLCGAGVGVVALLWAGERTVGFLDWFSRTPSRAKFARMLVKALKKAGDDRDAAYDDEEFRLLFTRDGEECGIANLWTLYREYCAKPHAERGGFLLRTARGLLVAQGETPTDLAEVEDRLLPTVRDRSYYALAEMQTEFEHAIPRQLLNERLCLGVVVNSENAMQMVQQGQLDDWGITLYEALETAKRNLAGREYSYSEIGKGTFCTATNDNYDASRMVLLDFVRKMKVTGDHIAMIPNRDWLIVTGSEDDEGLGIMAELSEKTLADPRPLTGFAFRLVNEEWQPWLPAKSHPLHDRFREMAVASLADDYAEQKGLLEAKHEKEGADIFVAGLMVFRNNDTNRVASTCVWSEGVDSLLPQADAVQFYKGDPEGDGGIVASGSWERVIEIVGGMMEATDHYPPRWRVRTLPSVHQLEQIGESDLFE